MKQWGTSDYGTTIYQSNRDSIMQALCLYIIPVSQCMSLITGE